MFYSYLQLKKGTILYLTKYRRSLSQSNLTQLILTFNAYELYQLMLYHLPLGHHIPIY